LKAAAKLSLGNTYLEKYASLPERKGELISEALLLTEAAFNFQSSKGVVSLALDLDLAQEYYFVGDLEKAHASLKRYLDETVQLGPTC